MSVEQNNRAENMAFSLCRDLSRFFFRVASWAPCVPARPPRRALSLFPPSTFCSAFPSPASSVLVSVSLQSPGSSRRLQCSLLCRLPPLCSGTVIFLYRARRVVRCWAEVARGELKCRRGRNAEEGKQAAPSRVFLSTATVTDAGASLCFPFIFSCSLTAVPRACCRQVRLHARRARLCEGPRPPRDRAVTPRLPRKSTSSSRAVSSMAFSRGVPRRRRQ